MSGKKSRRERSRSVEACHLLLRAFIGELRRILRRCGPEAYRRFPNMKRPCATCAFNPATDSWKGADATAFALQEAIAKDLPFYCHENMKRRPGGWDPATAPELLPCGGWLAIENEPDTKTAFMRAALRVGRACDAVLSGGRGER